LTVAGLYGVISSGIVERVREIGIRVTLGASRRDLIQMVMRQGLVPVVTGLIVGGLGALGAARLMRRFLFGVEPLDAMTFAGVPALILLVAGVACFLPARRALRVNPIESLRAD
jgi:ABC-type antimicrobial peptide transport system permease subunit